MALVEFTNNQAPYINAQNLNNNFNELKNEIEGTWQDITLNAGWENLEGNYQTAQYKLIGKQVIFRGLIKRTSGNLNPINIPSELMPSKTNYAFAVSADTCVPVYINSLNGVIEIVGYSANNNWVDISGITYFID